MEAAEILNEISQQVKDCTKCTLSLSRKNGVPGEGPATSEVMLIGEGPGFYENEQGRPFVGSAGKFLDELLERGGLKRSDVFITNVVKCRPPGNRDPLPEELATCNDFLEVQINTINPLIIVTLGRFSMARFIPNVRISDVHGKPRWIGERLIIPMYHPAAALHQPALRATVERDFGQIAQLIMQARKKKGIQEQQATLTAEEVKANQQDEKPTQMSLF